MGLVNTTDYDLSFPDGIPMTLSGDPGQPISTFLTGDPGQPISTLLTGNPEKPISTLMIGNQLKPITTLLIGDSAQPLTTLLIGDRERPISTDSKFELVNFPEFPIEYFENLLKIRVRMPHYSQVCFKIFGQEFFSVCLNGESQVITEPYVPNSMEKCETECCKLDTRPFPESHTRDGFEFKEPK